MSYRNQCLVATPRLFARAVCGFRSRSMRGGSLLALMTAVTGCLSRPIADSEPVTTNVVVRQQVNDAISSIDVLLMIDNSSSMADKQDTLAVAVPQLLKQLVQPQCVDADGKAFNPPIVAALGAEQPCSQGAPEFNPVNDIHIGIVTSSLGDHGEGTRCTPGMPSDYSEGDGKIPQPPDVNDKSYLIGSLDRGKLKLANDTQAQPTSFATVQDKGFLAWGSTTSSSPSPKGSDLDAATAIFRDMVSATAEKGCGFEAQLESWFRFLIDPVPPVLPLAPPAAGRTSRQGVDDGLLAQRAQFLRPDSLVAIVMLTDENDCSLRDTDYGWLGVRREPSIVTGSAPCATNPNDPCCYSCMSTGAPTGCAWTCPNAPGPDQPVSSNDKLAQANLRCWHQKQRFGVELTYPTSRYSVALTKKELCPDQTFGDMDCECTYAKSIKADCDPGARRFPNPLYSNVIGRKNDGVTDVVVNSNAIPRQDNSAVFLAGIVGVPWQDISEPDSQAPGATLRYIPVTDTRWTAAGGIWDQIVADYNDDGSERVPGDPRMIESIMPREGLPPPTAAVNADPINGHESNTAKKDLEYACIYRLPTPKPCECEPNDLSGRCAYENPNDCCSLYYPTNFAEEPGSGDDFKKPLCQDPATGSYDARTQYFAKGYPGLRELSVLHDYAEQGHVQGNSIVASICPKDLTSEPESSGYGYNPAVAALIDRLKVTLKGSCLPRPLAVEASGEVPCNVVEAVAPRVLEGKDCNTYCQEQGRNRDFTDGNPTGGPSSNMRAAVVESMKQSQVCDVPGSGLKCAEMCLCLLPQERRSNDKLKDPLYPSDLAVCQNADEHSVSRLDPGYCYVDPGLKNAEGNSIAGDNESLVAKCPSTQRRILRFVGNQPTAQGGAAVPLTGARVFSACQGSSVKNLNK